MSNQVLAWVIIPLFFVAIAPYFALLNLRHLDGIKDELKRIADTLECIADRLKRE